MVLNRAQNNDKVYIKLVYFWSLNVQLDKKRSRNTDPKRKPFLKHISTTSKAAAAKELPGNKQNPF